MLLTIGEINYNITLRAVNSGRYQLNIKDPPFVVYEQKGVPESYSASASMDVLIYKELLSIG